MQQFDTLLVTHDKESNGVCMITLYRPDSFNAIYANGKGFIR
ncbi:hypothetical protein [Oceanobacillus senegalensis]|nr:hypothetical protein [Oceanobacillus senegalensis]